MLVSTRRKIKSGLIFVALIFSPGVMADESDFDGYSYFVMGIEKLNYREMSDLVPVDTSTHVSNTALKTGGLFVINRALDFSLDTSATLFPRTATENWLVSGSAAGQAFASGLTYPGSPVQSNKFRLTMNSLQVLLHYKHSQSFRTVYGFNYSLSGFKRYDWVTVQGSAVTLPQGAVEEDTSNLDLALGVAYESGGLAKQARRWQLRAILHQPVWRQTVNTNSPDTTFTATNGWGVDVQGSFNFRVYQGIEAGIYASYGFRKDGKDTADGIELPKNRLTDLFWGLQLSWNLSGFTVPPMFEPK